ncbi:HEAT repeat domain-containing protein [Burkholderia glumae]|uniref:HEAT repeat domain-containing protein n=1 Tax=Burkholderia glumae TaxID=337 RepID=A0AAP9XVG8_BURGL|nr:HEAT repeat domain-containing protein [Burkholderia glumae]ACR32315.1 HEAT repeat containing protein [Burkholderia glumae BGR1]AJY63990.1 HEAT repeat family protein [Burkholderia glumae LMG 2196 = ATCC 33617]KHJ61809.1 PBS lyase [Burkholderia glumae]MCM2484494.1 HEAT repeat domain-containing protein [Burkholderia glumae]MCM2494862.1 HEAT repeat domain-containing protein [Burkholderia glumae]
MPLIPSRTAAPVHVETDRELLLASLGSASPAQRRDAARALAAHPDTAAVLVAQLQRESSASVRETIMLSLVHLRDQVALDGLVACLRSEDAALRNAAIAAMQQLPEEVAPLMSRLLADPDSDVRIFAVNVLESLRHPSVEAWLLEVIEQDPHVNVCAAAVDLLGEVGSARARAPLQRLQQRFPDEPFIRFAASIALQGLEDA